MHTPEEIRKARFRLGLTQDQFGQIIGKHRWTIWAWEKGRSRPTKRTIEMLDSLCKVKTPAKEIKKILNDQGAAGIYEILTEVGNENKDYEGGRTPGSSG